MTVSVITSNEQPTVNGTDTTFTVSFKFMRNDDLQVWQHLTGETDATLLTNPGEYWITGTPTAGTGVVNFDTAPLATTVLTFNRVTRHDQEADYSALATFPAETFEQSFDRPTMMIQEMLEETDRMLVGPVTEIAGDPNTNGGVNFRFHHLYQAKITVDNADGTYEHVELDGDLATLSGGRTGTARSTAGCDSVVVDTVVVMIEIVNSANALDYRFLLGGQCGGGGDDLDDVPEGNPAGAVWAMAQSSGGLIPSKRSPLGSTNATIVSYSIVATRYDMHSDPSNISEDIVVATNATTNFTDYVSGTGHTIFMIDDDGSYNWSVAAGFSSRKIHHDSARGFVFAVFGNNGQNGSPTYEWLALRKFSDTDGSTLGSLTLSSLGTFDTPVFTGVTMDTAGNVYFIQDDASNDGLWTIDEFGGSGADLWCVDGSDLSFNWSYVLPGSSPNAQNLCVTPSGKAIISWFNSSLELQPLYCIENGSLSWSFTAAGTTRIIWGLESDFHGNIYVGVTNNSDWTGADGNVATVIKLDENGTVLGYWHDGRSVGSGASVPGRRITAEREDQVFIDTGANIWEINWSTDATPFIVQRGGSDSALGFSAQALGPTDRA